jgi:hypothetical protein
MTIQISVAGTVWAADGNLNFIQEIPDGTAEVHQRWKNDTLVLRITKCVIRRIRSYRMRAEKPKQIGGANAPGNTFEHDQPEAAIASDQNNCGDGNPTSFFSIEQTPSTDYFLSRVAQNWKW